MIAELHALAKPHSWEKLVINPSENLIGTWQNVRSSTRPSLPQGKQCKFSQILAGVGACKLILHNHVVVNWQLLKQGNRWLASRDVLRSQVSTHRGYVFFLKSVSADNWIL